jgi:hypothetical protein
MSEQTKPLGYSAPPGVVLLKASAPYNHGVTLSALQMVEPNPKRTYVGQPRIRAYEAK